MRVAEALLILVPVLAADAPARAETGEAAPEIVLACEPASGNRVTLKMVLFSAEPHARVGIEFVAGGVPYRGQAPRPHAMSTSLEPTDHVEVVGFGPFVFDEHVPRELAVRGGIIGSELPHLGTITRSDAKDEPVRFRRHFPLPVPHDGGLRILVVVSTQRLDPRRFVLKVAYFNCGESFDRDLSAFVHFELAAKGENIAESCELKLFPRSERMDTSTWRPDEVTVVCFEPFEIPAGAPDTVYIRAGLYDQFDTKERLPVAGSDDGTGRVLVGRFVEKSGTVSFER